MAEGEAEEAFYGMPLSLVHLDVVVLAAEAPEVDSVVAAALEEALAAADLVVEVPAEVGNSNLYFLEE